MALPDYPKRLIEVDLPIRRISVHARDEKDSRCAHIPRLHIYPAARPLAACRAVACAALWPDPADPHCPDTYRKRAKDLMLSWTSHERQKLLSQVSRNRFERARQNPAVFDNHLELRGALLDFIADFSSWENASESCFLVTSRSLTLAAHASLGGTSDRPVLLDPFAGGGAIPIEGLRVGADVYASDYNPLAVLINKVVLEFAPKYGQKLSEDISRWGLEVNAEASKTLQELYPDEADGRIPMAYLWARTILSEAPDSGSVPIEVPLIRSMWLSRKGELAALRWLRDTNGVVRTELAEIKYADGKTLKVRRPLLEIYKPRNVRDAEKGTVARNSATCPVTGYTTPASRVQAQLSGREGGASDARMYCVVTISRTQKGRHYVLPSQRQVAAYSRAREHVSGNKTQSENGLRLYPSEPLPVMSGVFNAPLYGHSTWGSLFNSRQLIALTTYARIARKAADNAISQDPQYGLALAAVLGLTIDRLADLNASLCVWQLSTPNTAHVFGRWALPMIMDYGEINPLADAGGSPASSIWRVSSALKDISDVIDRCGEVRRCSADTQLLPDDSVDFVFTDPPYYNAIPYADISDFFYVWLRRSIGTYFPDLFSADLTPKDAEICEMSGWDPDRYAHKDKSFFEERMTEAARRARECLRPSGIGVVVFAHKTAAGWEAMLGALIEAGWIVTASWPIDTEMASRLRARKSAVLASSVHLVVRPRENPDGSVRNDEVGDWRDVLAELPRRIHDWMPRLAEEGVVGADAIFACLGPALEVFSRYSRVEKASGEAVTLSEYLEQIWAAVAKEALAMVFSGADATGLEPDARLTAMWLWTLNAASSADSAGEEASDGADFKEDGSHSGTDLSSSGGFMLEYDAARKIAQGLGANLDSLSSVVEISGDKARLLPVAERARHLFNRHEAPAAARARRKKPKQTDFFAELTESEEPTGYLIAGVAPGRGETALDRVHQTMILFGAGRTEALKRFLVEDGIGREPGFWRLAQALSALYPPATNEKRWVDGVLAGKKSLGF